MDEKLLKELIEYLRNLHHVHGNALPSLELYMDQVTGFMDEHLSSMRRHKEDKALTKTMINNYAKNETILRPLNENYFYSTKSPQLKDIYEEIFSFANIEMQNVMADVEESFEKAKNSFSEKDPLFENLPEEERQDLQKFCTLSLLAFDVYLKKQLIEKIVDDMAKKQERKKK